MLPSKLKLMVCALAGIVAIYAPAHAEDKAVETGTVDVVSTTPVPSLGVPINDIPANVQSAKGEAIREQQSLSVADYINNNMLGVNVNETQNNPFQPDVNFHGFTASPLLGAAEGLSVYVSGVRVNEPFGDTVNWDLIPNNAISSIDLMPGSNPLFGLNTLGGALSVQTKDGEHNPGGSLQAYGGSWGRRATEGEFGGQLSNGVDYFISGNMFAEDGWRDFSPSYIRQLFTKLGWHDEKTDVHISFTGADNYMNGNGLQPDSMISSLGRNSVYTQPDNTQNKMGFLTANLNHWFSDSLATNVVTYYRNTRTSTFNGDINDDFGEALATPGGLCDNLNGVGAGNDGCEGVVNRTHTSQKAYGLTGQLSWTTDKNLLIFGAGYDRADIDFAQTAQEFTVFSTIRGIGGVLDSVNTSVDLSGSTETWSLFATDTYHITPTVAAIVSGRYNHTDIETSDHLIPQAGTPGSLSGNETYDRLNPAVGLTYTPIKSLNFFGGYNEGSRAPSPVENGCTDDQNPCSLPNSFAGDPPVLQQVVSKTWEGGVRGLLGSQTKWSADVFHTTNDNDIQFTVVDPATGQGVFRNVGKTERNGIDLGIETRMGNFRWMAGYSFVDATYGSDFLEASPANALADVDGNITVSSGNRLPGIPRNQFKLRGEWQVTPQWVVGSTLNAFSDQYARGDENNADPAGKVAGYTIVNLDTRYHFGSSGWNLFAKVNNLFDHDYATTGMLLQNQFNPDGTFNTAGGNNERFQSPGAPRAAWVGLTYEFDKPKDSTSKADD